MGVDWTIVDEIRLFRWVAEFKPAGINKHFHMYCIVERMNHPDTYPVVLLQKENLKPAKVFSAAEIWDKLSQYYDFAQMDEIEDQIPSEPCDSLILKSKIQLARQRDFELPWEEYGDLILDHAKGEEETPSSNEDREGSIESPPGSEKEDTRHKRRSARLRKSTRLNPSSEGEEDRDSQGQNQSQGQVQSQSPRQRHGGEVELEEEGESSVSGSDPDGEDRSTKQNEQPMAKRTRHSSLIGASNTSSGESSPNKRKRRPESPQQQQEAQPPLAPAAPAIPGSVPAGMPVDIPATEAAATPATRTGSRVSSRLRNRK